MGFLVVPGVAQEPNEPAIADPTHTLHVVQSEGGEAISVPVKLLAKGKKTFVANLMPDGRRMESEYVLFKDNKLKFQWVAIQRGGLLAIQFIGEKVADGSFKGEFVALVDGVLRKDMSGRFNLKAIEVRK